MKLFCTIAALACIAGPAAAQEALANGNARIDTISAAVVSPAPGGSGWQKYYNYAVPPGVNLNFTDQCPSSAPNVVNGAFKANLAAQPGFALVGNYRYSKDGSKWIWSITWPSGAPAGSHVFFNVYCTP